MRLARGPACAAAHACTRDPAVCICAGLVDAKTVDVKADGDAVRLSIGRPKNAAKPKTSKHRCVSVGGEWCLVCERSDMQHSERHAW
jgi:hypothetical protein